MTVLLSCSMNSLASEVDTISSTGVHSSDSVLVAYNDLRKVNGKLIELKYEKEINNNLKEIIRNDSNAVRSLTNSLRSSELECSKRVDKVKRERNISNCISGVAIILLILSIL